MVLAQPTSFASPRRCCPLFPSHYGSRSTKGLSGRQERSLHVSIPLWFSLNPGIDKGRSQRQQVSIPLWFSLNLNSVWFLSCRIIRFHPTMVLAQPRRFLNLWLSPLGFHPTMVLAQQDVCDAIEDVIIQFPSHYGSRSTFFHASPELLDVVSFHPTMVLAQRF